MRRTSRLFASKLVTRHLNPRSVNRFSFLTTLQRRSSKEPVAAENEAGDDSMEALPATSNDSTISSSIAKTGRKRRRDSDEVMEEAPVAEFVAPDGGPAKGGSLEIQMTDVTDAALADNRKTGTSGDEEGVTPVEGKPGTDENPEDDVASTAAAQSKAASTLPARLIIRSRPGLTHVDLGLGPLPDDSKNVYSFADKLDRQYMDPLNNANVVPVSRMMSVKTRYAEIRWDQYGQDKQARKRVRLTRATDWKLEVPSEFFRCWRMELFCPDDFEFFQTLWDLSSLSRNEIPTSVLWRSQAGRNLGGLLKHFGRRRKMTC